MRPEFQNGVNLGFCGSFFCEASIRLVCGWLGLHMLLVFIVDWNLCCGMLCAC